MQPSSNNNNNNNNISMNTLQQFQMPFDPTSSHDDFLEQMLSSINNPSSPWPDLDPSGGGGGGVHPDENFHFDDQSQLATKFRHHQINGSGGAATKALMLQHQMLLNRNGLRPPSDNGLLPSPLSDLKPGNLPNDTSVQALFNGFAGSLVGQTQHFNHLQAQNLVPTAAAAAAPPPSGSTGAGGGPGAPAQPRQQRVRARRGQATDPHSIAERLRRERIAERMKALQELVPNANKTDKASMLDEIIDYVKFLQLQVKVLSMSRLGGAAAVAPLVADMSSEAGGGGDGARVNGTQTASSTNNDNAMTVTEHQVAKLMEEDMGSAMQYLQGKGLCLMPISLATAISTATCHSRNTMNHPLLGSNGGGGAEAGGPLSPNVSVLSVQSATMANSTPEPSLKDAASISKS